MIGFEECGKRVGPEVVLGMAARLVELVMEVGDERGEDFVLTLGVAIESAVGDTGLAGDVAHPCVDIPVSREDQAGGLEDGLPPAAPLGGDRLGSHECMEPWFLARVKKKRQSAEKKRRHSLDTGPGLGETPTLGDAVLGIGSPAWLPPACGWGALGRRSGLKMFGGMNQAPAESAAGRYRRAGWWPGIPLVERYRANAIARRPARVAVIDSRGRALTHRQLWKASGRVAAALKERGVGAGDVVVVCLSNWTEWMVVFLSALRLRAVPATVPVTLDADTLSSVALRTRAAVVAVPTEFRGERISDYAREAAESADHRCDVLSLSSGGEWNWIVSGRDPLGGAKMPGADHLMFTSSTTGQPKAVMHTEDTLAALNLGFAERYGLGGETAIFMASPLGHSVGSIHGARLSLHLGAPLVLQDVWDPVEAIRMVAEHRCAFTVAATPFLVDLVEARADGGAPKFTPLRAFLCGGAHVPPSVIEQAASELPETFVTVLWGMTEGGVTCCPPDAPWEKVLATAGAALPGLELEILAPDGKAQAQGREGELAMRGPGVFVGYWNEEEIYRSQLTPEGFFRTGDQAKLDSDGYLVLTGRLKDLIIRGGVNISPVPIETILFGHPNVASVAVIGLPDERLGERICAVVRPAGPAPDLDDLISWCRAQGLPKRLWPEALRIIDAIPTTPAGKIQKRVLRERIKDGSL